MIFTPDTNLLVYIQDRRDPVKQVIATDIYRRLTTQDNSRIALQVMGELYTVLTRKLQQDPPTAAAAVKSLNTVFDPFGYDAADVHVAISLAADGVLSYWDGLLVSAAARKGCSVLVSEDMQDGFRFDGLEVVTPFSSNSLNPRLDELLGDSV